MTFVLVAAVEHIGDQGRSEERGARDRRAEDLLLAEDGIRVLADPVEAAVDREPHLAAVRLLGRNEAGRVGRAVDREDMKAVRRAVAAVGRSDAAMVEGSAPPRARERGQHVMVMRLRAVPAVGGAEIMMLGRVGVAGEAHRIFAALHAAGTSASLLTRFW